MNQKRDFASLIARATISAIFLVLSLLYLLWTNTSILGGLGGDNATYLLTAGYFSPYEEHTPVEQYVALHSPYPPVVPLVLAVFGGAESLRAAHAITTLALILAFAGIYWFARLVGISRSTSLASMLIFALAFGTYYQALEIHSESYFMATVMGMLCCACRAEGDGHRSTWLYAAACFAGVSVLTRSAGIAGVVALLLHVWVRQPHRLPLVIVLAVAPAVAWAAFGVSVPGKSSYVDMMHKKLSEIAAAGSYWEHLVSQIDGLRDGWSWNFKPLPAAAVIVQGFGIMGLLGGGIRLRQGKVDGILVVTYAFLLLVWPFTLEPLRYVLPIMPIIVVHAFYLIESLRLAERIKRLLSVGVVLVWFSIVAPPLLETAIRFNAGRSLNIGEWRHSAGWYIGSIAEGRSAVERDTAILEMMQRIGSRMDPDQCVYAPKPTITSFFSGRIAMIAPPEDLDQTTFERELKEKGCRAVIAFVYDTPTVPALYPLQRLGGRATVLDVATVPNGRIVALYAQVTEPH